jgi:hypothetical protein
MSQAAAWLRNKQLQRSCPPGLEEEVWYSITARYQRLRDPVLQILAQRGPMSTQAVRNAVCPALNDGRMGEVLVILRRQGLVIRRADKLWQRP